MTKKEIVVKFSKEGVSVSACNVMGLDLIFGAYLILKTLAKEAGFAEGTEEFDEVVQVNIEAMQLVAELDGVGLAVAELLESVGLTNEVDM